MAERGMFSLGQKELRNLAVGGLVGALVGVAAAWILMTSPPESSEGRRRRKGQELGLTEVLRMVATFLKLVQRLAGA